MRRLTAEGHRRLGPLLALAMAAAAASPAAAAVQSATSLPASCGNLWEEMSEECMSALETRYLDERVSRTRRFEPGGRPDNRLRPFQPLPRRVLVRWRDVFDAPLATRRQVEGALGRAVCLVPEGAYEPDLAETCAAAALARLGILHAACVPFLGRDSDGDYWEGRWSFEFERLDEEVPERGPEYDRRRAVIEEARIHFAWRLQMCRAVPPSALVPLAALFMPPPHYDNPEWHQGYEMLRSALALGSEWALFHFTGSNAVLNALSRSDLTAAYLHRAVKAYVMPSSRDDEPIYLLAAMGHDAASHRPRLDWSGWSVPFTEAEIEVARRKARDVLASGWEPLPVAPTGSRRRRDSTAEAEHPGKVVVRRWITEEGEERAITADGTVLVTGSDY